MSRSSGFMNAGSKSTAPLGTSTWHLFLCLCLLLSGTLAVVPWTDISAASPPAPRGKPKGDLYCLVVGISRYADPKIRKLDFAANDAVAFGEILKKETRLFAKKHIRILTDEKATRRAISKFLTHDLRRAGKDDTIILFFSGHGQYDPFRTTDFYFAPYDVEPAYLAATGVKMSGLDFLQGLDTERVLVIADTCHSGGISQWGAGAKTLPPNLEVFMRDFKDSTGKVILTSAGPNEQSYEMEEIKGQPKLKNGVFTHFFLQGLRGKADTNRDGAVTVHEAYQYAYDMTREATGGLQHPQFEGRYSGAFAITFTGSVIPPWKLKRSLFMAIGSGNIRKIKELRAELLDIGSLRDDANRTPLIAAAERGLREAVELVLTQNPDLEARDDRGNTALMAACAAGRTEIAKILLARGADPNAKNKAEETPLTAAARNGHPSVVKLLLDHKANVRAMNSRGSTALMLAAYKGHLGIVRMLLDAGADVTAKDFKGRTALGNASRYGHSDVVRLLMSRMPRKKALSAKERLFRAVLVGDVVGTKRALETGAKVDARTAYNDTPLSLAAGLGHVAVIKLLLERRANVNARIGFDSTALSWAAFNGRARAARLLLEHGAKVNSRDRGGSTPLTYAAQNGHTAIVKLLLAHGADANNRSAKGNTALILASTKGHLDVVRTLLAHGANPSTSDKHGFTALMGASQRGAVEVVKLLLDRAADINAGNEQQETALMLASEHGHLDTVRLLLKRGAEVDARNRKGATALLLASREGFAGVVSALLAAGADPMAADKEGATPLSVASEGGHARIAGQLAAAVKR